VVKVVLRLHWTGIYHHLSEFLPYFIVLNHIYCSSLSRLSHSISFV
jgi:hypothetical protein